MTAKLRESLIRLDAAIQRHGTPLGERRLLLNHPPVIPENTGLCLAENIDRDGVIFSIGGNDFDFIGKRDLDTLQSMLGDYPGLESKKGTIFIVQTDVNPVFAAADGSIWGGMIPDDDCHLFGQSMAGFIDMLTACYLLNFSANQNRNRQDRDAFLHEVRQMIAPFHVDTEHWINYFYG